jgi:3-phosphoshikimate 1-carboxyvinyltransferase
MRDGAASIASNGRLEAPAEDLYAANSGTTVRLLTGVLAGQPFMSRLTGDASLSRRPMGRIVDPLSRMGADIHARENRAPLEIHGRNLHGISYSLPVASAQVKSSILLAGLFAKGETRVDEPAPTRDHTERMFAATCIEVVRENANVTLRGGQRPQPFDLAVPGDISSAAFLFAAAALSGGDVTVWDVGVNPTRAAFLETLVRMGASVEMSDQKEQMGEPRANVRVTGPIEHPIRLGASEVPALIDELPLIALLATQAPGTSEVTGAAELRVKESDRIATVVGWLRQLGADIQELPDGFVVRGPTPLRGAGVESQGDHRLAMMLAVAGTIASGETVVEGAEAAAVSFPEFASVLHTLEGRIDVA